MWLAGCVCCLAKYAFGGDNVLFSHHVLHDMCFSVHKSRFSWKPIFLEIEPSLAIGSFWYFQKALYCSIHN